MSDRETSRGANEFDVGVNGRPTLGPVERAGMFGRGAGHLVPCGAAGLGGVEGTGAGQGEVAPGNAVAGDEAGHDAPRSDVILAGIGQDEIGRHIIARRVAIVARLA